MPKFGTAIGFLTAVTKCFEKLLSKISEAWIEFCCAKMKKKKDLQKEIKLYTRMHKQENVEKIKKLIWLEPIIRECGKR